MPRNFNIIGTRRLFDMSEKISFLTSKKNRKNDEEKLASSLVISGRIFMRISKVFFFSLSYYSRNKQPNTFNRHTNDKLSLLFICHSYYFFFKKKKMLDDLSMLLYIIFLFFSTYYSFLCLLFFLSFSLFFLVAYIA